MKTTKRILAIVLAFVLSLSVFALSASAVTGGTITLNNTMTSVSINGRTFNAYKIFDVTTDGAGHYAYTFSNASVTAYFAAKSPTITTGAGAVAYINTIGAEAFAKEMFKAIVTDATVVITPATATGVGTQAVFSGLAAGYYLIYDAFTGTAATKSACILTTNDQNVTINLKWDVPTISKTITNGADGSQKATTADGGSVINFNLTSKVPDMTGYSTYDFTIKDTMTDLALQTGWQSNLVVKINNVVISPSAYTVTQTGSNYFEISFTNFMQYKALVDDAIVVTFPATFTPSTNTAVGVNDVYATYSNNPLVSGSHTDTPHDLVKVYCVAVTITKVDGQNSNTKLSGATFELDKYVGGTWVAKQTLTTDATGIISFGKLGSGQYRLVETVAPSGYNLLVNPIGFTITATFSGTDLATLTSSNPLFTVDLGGRTLSATVQDNAGSILPGTGGIGVTVFYIAGLSITVGAALFLIYRKKRTA